jgi:predicted O-methyltransferase YrrM
MFHAPSQDSGHQSHYECVIDHQAAQLIKFEAYSSMNQLEGWCSFDKASFLIDLILKSKPLIVVEIGVYGGKSLVPMAHALRFNQQGKIFGIDPWDTGASLEGATHPNNISYWSWVDHNALMNALILKIDEFHLKDQIQLIRNTSLAAEPIDNIDILHIDGNHSDVTSYIDVTKWVPLVNKGGWIVFDDMTWYENGVFTNARAVQWLDTHCVRFAQFRDNCDWGVWYKP